jgi:ABC-type Fe3+-siderophore transport system permease subunit
MSRRTSRILWGVWMTGGGIATAVIVYLRTDSAGWALVGLLLSGVVLNAVGQAIVQPINAVRRTRSR